MKIIFPSSFAIGTAKVMGFLSMVVVIRMASLIYSQSVVLELRTLGIVEVGEVQVECFDSYYPSLETCVFVLRSNLTVQAFGRSHGNIENNDNARRVLSRHATVTVP